MSYFRIRANIFLKQSLTAFSKLFAKIPYPRVETAQQILFQRVVDMLIFYSVQKIDKLCGQASHMTLSFLLHFHDGFFNN